MKAVFLVVSTGKYVHSNCGLNLECIVCKNENTHPFKASQTCMGQSIREIVLQFEADYKDILYLGCSSSFHV